MVDWGRERLGEILLKSGLVTEEQLEKALAVQTGRGGRLGRILLDQGAITEEDLAGTLATQKRLKLVDLTIYDIDSDVTRLVSAHIARRYQVLPIKVEDDNLIVAMANPLDIQAIDTLRMMTGYDIQPVVATETDLERAIRQYLDAEESAVAAESAVAPATPRQVEEAEAAGFEDVPVVNLANRLIGNAIDERASDVHFEPQKDYMRIRYRIDGVLYEATRIPRAVEPALTSRLKIMAEADIAEKRVPQDGHFTFRRDAKDVDVRASIMPTVHGENVSLRLLRKDQWLLDLAELGFEKDSLQTFRALLHKPYGAILVTGPTGSGKTTTMYAALGELNTGEKKTATIEDPVEYQIPGVMQTQVNVRAGLTFAVGLRSLVRCDPDTVLIGEIRDLETAKIAIRSALTGHLVLSSLHANDAPSALTTLIDMGIQPYVISSAVVGILAQRLARRLCNRCKEPYEPDEAVLSRAGSSIELEPGAQFYRPKGCRDCGNTGFSGRVGIFEVMQVSREIAHLCVTTGSTDAIRDAAVAGGMRVMREDGLVKVRNGITSLEEIMRVVV